MENKNLLFEGCECDLVHDSVVDRVRVAMPDEELLADVAELFKVFGDTTRTRILSALFEAELCVCDIAVVLNMTKSAVSHQLRFLREVNLIKARRDGKNVFYSLADSHVKTILSQGLEHIEE